MSSFLVRHLPPGSRTVVEDQVEAGSAAEARERFVEQGAVVVAVSVSDTGREIAAVAGFDVPWWCRELRTLLRSGMTAVEAIEALAAGAGTGPRSRVIGSLLGHLNRGLSLSRAMDATQAFPPVLLAGVRAGERTSTLVESLDDYLRYEELLDKLKRQAVSAAIYPALVAGLGLLISVFLLTFVVPRFSRIYVGAEQQVSVATMAVLGLSQWVAEYTAFVWMIIAAIAGWIIIAVRRGWHRRFAAQVLAASPQLDAQVEHFRRAKLFQSLALMFRGGYTVDEALGVGARLDLGAGLARRIEHAREAIRVGRGVDAALREAGLTDEITGRMITAGSRGGQFDATLQLVADRHAAAFTTFVERATRIVEPLLLLLVAMVVGGIVVLMYMPIFDIASGLEAGPP
jgi:general secretion pathway protein F